MKQLEEMELSPAQFSEFLSWWKEWEQGANKTSSAAEASKKLSKKEKKEQSKKGKEAKREAMVSSRNLLFPLFCVCVFFSLILTQKKKG